MTNTDTADLMKCASKMHFRTIHHADKYWIRPNVIFLTVYNFPRKVSICLPKRLKGSYFDQNCRTRIDKKKIEKITPPNPTCCKSICLYRNVTYTNTPPKITRKYVFMVIPRINIKRLTRMFCYYSHKLQPRIKIKSHNKNATLVTKLHQ